MCSHMCPISRREGRETGHFTLPAFVLVWRRFALKEQAAHLWAVSPLLFLRMGAALTALLIFAQGTT